MREQLAAAETGTASRFQGLPNIPAMQVLFARPQWVAWRHEIKDGKPKKPPINPATGKYAEIDRPSTWGSYPEAIARTRADGLSGVGYVLSGEDELIGIDLDRCIDPNTGVIKPAVAEILEFAETYAERSPSGTGIRLFAVGLVEEAIVDGSLGIEIYSTGRYLTVTGAHINGMPLQIGPAPRTMAALKAAVGIKTNQGGQEAPASADQSDPKGEKVWGRINHAALNNLTSWVPELFPKARPWKDGYRVSSRVLGRDLEEDLSITPGGIKDFGVHDLGDATQGRRSPIELVIERGRGKDHAEAARWICERLEVAPESLGWIDWTKPGAYRVEPTYPSRERPLEEVRACVETAVRTFLDAADRHNAGPKVLNIFERIDFNQTKRPPPVHAVRVGTGVGKTRIAARLLAEKVLGAKSDLRYLYAVPTHRLGDEIEAQFREYGVPAKVFRGRQALDPERLGHPMCDDVQAVEAAIELGAPVQQSCCKGKNLAGHPVKCQFFETCAYQRQRRQKPRVWIAAHQILFHAQDAIGKVAAVIVDEGFWQAGIRTPKSGLSLDELEASLPLKILERIGDDLEGYRRKLAKALRRSDATGVRQEHLLAEGLTAETCTEARKLEWARKTRKTAIWPGMSPMARTEALKAADDARHIGAFSRVWAAARDLLDAPDGTVSGHLFVDEIDSAHGKIRVVKTRGIREVVAQWQVPTLLMDATLPALDLIRPFYPRVAVVADLEAAMPHARITQVLAAPTSSRKLARGDPDSPSFRNVRRYILARWLEHGRQPALVIMQQEAEAKLRGLGLPPGIEVAHYNAIAGLDRFKDVRLLILAGRTLLQPHQAEADAAALSGRAPRPAVAAANGAPWYDRVIRGIRLPDGTGRGVQGDQHPDPLAECVRWQVCEAELLQALGRVRGVNRTAANLVSIDILTDVCLPVTVDTVQTWDDAVAGLGRWIETAVEGVILTSPADMAKAFPAIWSTPGAAKEESARAGDFRHAVLDRLFSQGGRAGNRTCSVPPWSVFTYRPAGRGQQSRTAYFDTSIVADPKAWLEARLGVLGTFAQAGVEQDD